MRRRTRRRIVCYCCRLCPTLHHHEAFAVVNRPLSHSNTHSKHTHTLKTHTHTLNKISSFCSIRSQDQIFIHPRMPEHTQESLSIYLALVECSGMPSPMKVKLAAHISIISSAVKTKSRNWLEYN